MIFGIGIDLTEISRIERAWEKHPRFIERVLTPNERSVLANYSGRRQLEFLAGRFSAKESFSKAYGTGIGKFVSFSNIEILTDLHSGRPIIAKYPQADQFQAFLSISHTDSLVMTEVILEKQV
ncbi:holo-ACP synthase [Liquorilactobacillus vini]|nr:holo-ACP synthase [Liquorilactobacillus vini]